MKKTYDIVLFGATGYTGRLIFEYLANQKPELQWAVAGRNTAKLNELRDLVKAAGHSIDVLPGSCEDTEFAKSARVVISAVGPYSGQGEKLVRTCVAVGTHCLDCSGEPDFVKRVSKELHHEAEEKKVLVVSCCGFDSVPPDVGTLFLVDSVRSKIPGAQFSCVTAYVRFRGGPRYEFAQFLIYCFTNRRVCSGGTIASMMNLMNLPSSELNELRQPYALNVAPYSRGLPVSDQLLIGRSSVGWTFPSLMAITNSRIVRKTESLLLAGNRPIAPYNKNGNFVFTEVGFSRSFFTAVVSWLMIVVAIVALMIRPIRSFLRTRFPQGQGPPASQRAKNSFEYLFVGEATAPDGKRYRAQACYRGGDPYSETAVMVAECALCLVFDRLPRQGGCLTPAVAFGMPLVRRLQKAGHRILLESLAEKNGKKM